MKILIKKLLLPAQGRVFDEPVHVEILQSEYDCNFWQRIFIFYFDFVFYHFKIASEAFVIALHSRYCVEESRI